MLLSVLFVFCTTSSLYNCASSACAVQVLSGVQIDGDMAEWLGRGLQNLVQRFESACRLNFFGLMQKRCATTLSGGTTFLKQKCRVRLGV